MSRFLVFVLSALTLARLAYAAPPEGADPNSPRAAWFNSLRTPEGASCCSIADCRPVEAQLVTDGWQIRIDDEWVDVPPEVILRRDNQDGRPIACLYFGKIRCFVPPNSA